MTAQEFYVVRAAVLDLDEIAHCVSRHIADGSPEEAGAYTLVAASIAFGLVPELREPTTPKLRRRAS